MLRLLGSLTVAVLAAAAAAQPAQPPFRDPGDASPRIAALRRAVTGGDSGAVAAFWDELRAGGAPLVEPVPGNPDSSLVPFVWRGSPATRNVVVVDGVAAGVGGVDPANSRLIRLAGTDVWFRTYEIRNDARFTYRLSENDSLVSFVDLKRNEASVSDPLNPRRYETGHSYVELPDAPPQRALAAPMGPRGMVERTTFGENGTFGARPVWVYTPPGFERETRTYPLLVVLDGSPYTTLVPTPTILDSLIADGRLPPIVAVMVGSVVRIAELDGYGPFSSMQARELVPWMRTHYRATTAPGQTIIAGSSRGGLTAASTALKHPDVFGNVISQSGSFWWTPANDSAPDWMAREVARLGRLPVNFFIEVGAMEIPPQLDTNRRVRDALRANGYDVVYREFNGNHTYLQWRGGIADGLMALIGAPAK
jgi:enterochelin esterase family protein